MLIRAFLLIVCLLVLIGGVRAEEDGCSSCHGDTTLWEDHERAEELLVTPGSLDGSVHAGLDCIDCHQDAAEIPHAEQLAEVSCQDCHVQEGEVYQQHGALKVGDDPDIPSCADCHGAHDTRSPKDRESRVHPTNLPRTCRSCHADLNLVEKHDILHVEGLKLYDSSVHGQASRKGTYVAAVCNDCHSALDPDGRRTAHRILGPADPESTIYHFSIPDTCGQCHRGVTQDFWEGIHGQRVARGRVDSPVCTSCHGEHGILSPSDSRSPVSAGKLAEAICARCHESLVLNERYGLPSGRLRSYIDSYHGLKSKAGDVRVANCASCHGSHRILPHTDPTSSIHPDNLQETCGECHPEISPVLARAPIHETATGLKTGWPRLFTVLYVWIIVLTIGFMTLHVTVDFLRHIIQLRRRPFVLRLTPNETAQHWLLMLSFTVLVITGFSLRFYESWWVKLLFGWGGGEGFLLRGKIHRGAAMVFLVSGLWHVIYLASRRGKRWLKDMLPRRRDLRDLWWNLQYFLGRRKDGPRFERFSYMEKMEYWALIWGGLIMTVTGVLLWFDNFFVDRWGLPKGLLDVMLVIHYFEAWLATLAIFIWHGYHAVYSPAVYPMNVSWIDGRMPKDQYDHEHPEGPNLKAFEPRGFFEREEEPDQGAEN